MAGENLESTLIIKDEASEVLKNIEDQSEETEESLANLAKALKEMEAIGNVSISAAVIADELPNDKRKTTQTSASGINAIEKIEPPPNENSATQEEDTGTSADEIIGAYLKSINEVARSIAGNTSETKAILSEARQTIENIKQSIEAANAPAEQIKEIKEQIEEAVEVDLSSIQSAIESANNAIEEECEIIEEAAEEAEDDWEDAQDEIEEAAEEIGKEAEKTGEKVKKGIRGLGADIGGWWSITKDVLSKIGDIFAKLAEESDKLNTRIARFGLVADSEGVTKEARGARSEELYKQHQNFAQALGVQSEAFNETVLNMYSNGAGVVKSIQDAQQIAAASYMAMDIAGLRGRDKDAVMGEVQSMVAVGIADPDQIQESMKIAPNILRTIEKQWQKNLNGKAFKMGNGEEITDATGKIAVLAQEGEITAELVAQAMVNSAKETQETWKTLPSTWEKLKNRVGVIVENMSAQILKKFGELADDPQIANFVMSALNFGQELIDFVQTVVVPVIGGALMAIMSALTSIFDVLSNWYTAVPVLLVVGAALVQVAVNTGLVTRAFGALKIVLTALSANPVVAILGAVLLTTLAVAELVRTTQTGQEIMLEVTAAVGLAFQQVGAAITNIPQIMESAWRGMVSYISSFVTKIQDMIAGLLEKLGEFSDTAKEAAENIRANIAEREAEQEAYDKESEEIKKGWMSEFEQNFDFYQEYRKQIPDIAKENLEKNKNDLKLDGFLDKILKNQQNAPGTKNNPANVKGKVSIDGEYFDIIKKAAGAEIVNRYTTMRPTVNAKFGDINQINARDVLKDLVNEMERAKGASLAEAQAQGA